MPTCLCLKDAFKGVFLDVTIINLKMEYNKLSLQLWFFSFYICRCQRGFTGQIWIKIKSLSILWDGWWSSFSFFFPCDFPFLMLVKIQRILLYHLDEGQGWSLQRKLATPLKMECQIVVQDRQEIQTWNYEYPSVCLKKAKLSYLLALEGKRLLKKWLCFSY